MVVVTVHTVCLVLFLMNIHVKARYATVGLAIINSVLIRYCTVISNVSSICAVFGRPRKAH